MNPNAPLVLRAIEYESLGDGGEADDPVKPKPTREGLLSRAKKAVKDRVSNSVKKLRDPVAELSKLLPSIRTMLARWGEIQQDFDREQNVSAYDAYLGRTLAKFDASGLPEDHAVAYVAGLLLKEKQQCAHANSLAKLRGSLEEKWLSEFPKAKAHETIRAAVLLRIEIAKAGLKPDRVEAEQKRLADLGDYDGVARVKSRFQSKLDEWQGQLKVIDDVTAVPDRVLETQRLLRIAGELVKGGKDAGTRDRYMDNAGMIFDLVKVEPIRDPDLAQFEKTHTLVSPSDRKTHYVTREELEKNFRKLK